MEDYCASTEILFENDKNVIMEKLQKHLESLFKFEFLVKDVIFDEVNNNFHGSIYIPEPKIEYTHLSFYVLPTGTLFGGGDFS